MRDARDGSAGTSGKDSVYDCDGAFESLRIALIEVVDGKASSDVLREPVRQLCVFAHREEIKAEELLIRFKELWSNLPPHAGLPRGRQRNDLMARVTTMCIEEFYGPKTNGREPSAS